MKAGFIGENDQPMICVPLVGRNYEGLHSELKDVLRKNPDLLEWRADFYEGITDQNDVVALARRFKKLAGDIPMIFTLRSSREGGHPTSLTDPEAIDLIAAVCVKTDVEYVDCELSHFAQDIKGLRKIASEHKTRIITSFHDFNGTPPREELLAKFTEAKQLGADVAKLAVMAKELQDVLTLLEVTLEAKKHVGIPIIAVSMGEYGVLSRVMGGFFGSSVTFAVGHASSAPGQIPIEDLRAAMHMIQRCQENQMD